MLASLATHFDRLILAMTAVVPVAAVMFLNPTL